MCAEVLFGKGWNLDHEIFMDFRSWKAPREVAWAGPQTLTVLSMAKGKGRERDISLGQPVVAAASSCSRALGAPVFLASSREKGCGLLSLLCPLLPCAQGFGGAQKNGFLCAHKMEFYLK